MSLPRPRPKFKPSLHFPAPTPAPVIAAALVLAGGLSGARAQFVINEIDADTDGSDRLEFVEIYDGGTGNSDLTGRVLVFFNGSNDQVYNAIDLSGHSTDANGFFLVANPDVATEFGVTIGIEVDPGGSGAIQNGADAVALLDGAAADYPNGTPVDDETVTDNLIDAVVYGTDDPDDFELLDALLPPASLQLNEDAIDANDDEDDSDDKDFNSLARVPDGGPEFTPDRFVVQPPTPGTTNAPVETLTLTPDPADFDENAGAGASTITVTRSGDTTSAVTVTLAVTGADASPDATEAAVEPTAEIPAGEASVAVRVDAVDDLWPDGDQTVTVTANAPGYQSGDADLVVRDAGDDAISLVLNELYPAIFNDANGDGAVETSPFENPNDDEFIELVNSTDAPLDVSGWSMLDAFNDNTENPDDRIHVFPEGTVLDPGCAVVVFGGWPGPDGISPDFSDALVQTSSNGGLFLNDNGDRVRVLDDAGNEVFAVSYPAHDSGEGSLTLSPDGDVAAGFTGHFALNGTDFTPGAMVDGTPFCEVADALGLSISVASVVEDAGTGAATATVTRDGPTELPLEVTVVSGDPSELTAASPVTIPSGETSLEFPLDAVDDSAEDGTQTVTVTVQAAGYVPATAEIDVLDDGNDTTPTNLVINEFDADQPGDEDREFIELFNPNANAADLSPFVLVLYNGANEDEYFVQQLSGTIPGGGYFVIGDFGVPGVDLTPDGWDGDSDLQNGADAIALFIADASDFGDLTDAFFPPDDAVLVDAVVYATGEGDDLELLDALTPGEPQVDEGSNNNTEAAGRTPDGGATFEPQVPSPGAANGSVVSGFAAWATANGIPGAAKDSDDDSDGTPAALEYALGLDPTSPDAPAPVIAADAAGITVAFAKGAEAAADPSASYALESTPSLATGAWSPLAADVDDATIISATLPGGSPDTFVRLVFTCD